MNVDDIISRIRRGEDSVTQFKRQAVGVAKLSDEMVAFANAEGGVILFGVDDDGTDCGWGGARARGKLTEGLVAAYNIMQ